jgi:hypothetical protein
MALPGTVSADDLKSPLEEPKDCSSGSPFQLGELGTFLGALPTSVGATGKCFNLRMLVASVASSSQARASTSQSGYAYFEPRSSSCVVRVAIRAQSRTVAIVAATTLTSRWASPVVTKRSSGAARGVTCLGFDHPSTKYQQRSHLKDT